MTQIMQLKQRVPKNLVRRLPSLRMVEFWVNQAKRLPAALEYYVPDQSALGQITAQASIRCSRP